MSDIEKALKALRLVHDKYQITGRFVASKDVAVRWPTELPRSAEVDFLFNEYEPVGVKIETGLTPLKLFDIASLQKGQFGYRWINAASGAVLSDEWPVQDLVIMDDNGGGKPIIAVTDVDQTPVYASYDVVAPFQVADSLADFILALSKMIDVVYGEFNIFDLSDDDGVSDAFLTRLQDEIGPVLGGENTDRFVDYFYG
ncbi:MULTISPECIES: hypothetical protein [unclassified Pseudomonas]|uniref:hypothetical protein n=1 Tax=unclassified Pseudomonas TaxID=196821 RepID=UPI000A1E08EF|nr:MULTISPECIES: hypothetical protein [unclassified Pseudomonas]